MPRFLKTYVRIVDAASWYMGLFSMYLVFVMIGILGYASVMKIVAVPPIWSVEMAQFVMVAYFTLGGAFAIRQDEHVRMDLLYAAWSRRGRARADLVTGLAMIFFLVMLQIGGAASLIYAFQYGEKGFSAWAPYMAPIKVVINIGLFLTLLQAIATWLKDWARLRGEPIA